MEQPHIPILRTFDDLKFNLGKKTLSDYIKGDQNKTIEKNNLDELNSYGCLYMLDKKEIFNIIDELIKKKYLDTQTLATGHQIVIRTSSGIKEIFEKKFKPQKIEIKKINSNIKLEETKISETDRKLFETFDFFLKGYNDEQKKAIISQEKNILCIAGAGTGKTTVLTKRIEFLCKFKSIEEKRVLAITFTKKAKEEMKNRLRSLNMDNVAVETFNSFSEKMLKRHSNKLYKDEVKVARYSDKIKVVRNALDKLNIRFEIFYEDYFTKKQVREKSADELLFIFVNDIFTIIDYYKNKEDEMPKFYERENTLKKKRVANTIHDIAKLTARELKTRNLRDFSDQILETLRLFREHREAIPRYEYILIDEYQDVNKVQVDLIKMLNATNLFAVGDPRQAIYGWRGSQIRYILDFAKENDNTQVIQLKHNYRSTKSIVEFFNKSIKDLGLVDLESTKNAIKNDVFLIEQDSELLEKRFVLEAIKNSKAMRCEIFVLARTNRVLEGYADLFRQQGIRYAIKSEEEYKNAEPKEDEVILATIHSIKGMEAQEVYLVGANTLSFPNKVQDNFVLALVKEDDDYDKEQEELRLFYVALSRAKERLVITYTGNYSKFIKDDMLEHTNFKKKNKNIFDYASEHKKLDSSNTTVLKNILKDWRKQKSDESNLPSYMIISNAAIEELVRRLPQNKMQLMQVNGLGEIKIAKYGNEILKIING